MPTFQYRALQTNGKIAEGVLDASGRPDAMRQIETLGLRLVNLTEKAAGAKGIADFVFEGAGEIVDRRDHGAGFFKPGKVARKRVGVDV